ncbi:MAG TPA: MlaD family protein, partial [Bdellovibrionales bacterium]|nr:MlaD family protein [Bdellovibrionales bacterium]
EGPGIFGQKKYHFRADSAGGLVENSAVKMAGIKVGVIKDIVLEDGRAKIDIALDGDTELGESTRVVLKSDGILGDKHVELIPGKPGEAPILEGSEIPAGDAKGGMDDVMAEVGRVARSMNELMETLNKAAKEADDSTSIGRIIKNIELLTGDLKDITGENKEKINEIVERVRNLSKNIDTYINEESLARVDRSLKNIEDITNKLSKGEGTLGRLINDEQTVEELNSAITNVNKFLGGADKMETSVDFHSEFLSGDHTKSFLGLKIQPGLDRYYEIALITDSNGVRRSTVTNSTSDGVPHTYEEETTYKNKFKITGLFAKNFWDLTLKAGLIENEGGAGVDYHLFGKRLRLSVEAFKFTDLQLRAFARFNFFKGLYVIGGGDNLLSNDEMDASGFIGAGLFITNDDLKLLATKFSF